MSEDTDTILKNIQSGNLQEFEKLFREYYPLLCHYALRFVRDTNQSEEIVQELFCQLWENRKTLKIHTSLKAYLYKATYFNSLQVLRKRGVKKKYQEYIKNNKQENSLPIDSVEEKDIHNIVNRTLTNLPDRCSQIFKMSRFEGLKYQEIADKLSISVKTVEANMGKALKAFRKSLKDYIGIIVL
ncbi:RNA polymerase sigma-70 factor [Labilibaculum antarcticum]|uniref:RNA polymerase sigma-70 factor n=1 Tax=Labilibaculum antarcticum TaxID=1717717 RepID=A0A1Y1CS05_9BACT|nr:RNA polymerase sigma-70 factor [Labilibaculum antarcticum]BAX82021.1 RNA polymerase sigma-70 factor [Labilibaculum antarcticum]